jgi:hypothetical protein
MEVTFWKFDCEVNFGAWSWGWVYRHTRLQHVCMFTGKTKREWAIDLPSGGHLGIVSKYAPITEQPVHPPLGTVHSFPWNDFLEVELLRQSLYTF